MLLVRPEPMRFSNPSSSAPDTLALCFFKGLPTKALSRESTADFFVSASPDGMPEAFGGVVDTGGVEPAAGVLEFVASPSPPTASDECWRLSYLISSVFVIVQKGKLSFSP